MIRRRTFVTTALAAAGAGLRGDARKGFAATPPPETSRIRLNRYPFDVACVAPVWVAEELRTEGFETVEYVSDKGDSEYDSADTIRFFALRLHEAGVIKSTPHKIIADGMDWRFVNELKKELK
jgi:NitT/TauT family transport system substrate-binding protein